MFKNSLLKIIFILSIANLVACSGVQTFQSSLRAGDTAAIAAGWKQNFSRDKITVTITPSSGLPVTLLPGDAAVRAVVNMYPDPISSMVISEATNQDITPFAQTYALGTSFYTLGDKDWWQTTVFIDLPASLPVGLATVEISNLAGASVLSTVNIVSGIGQPELFEVDQNGPLNTDQFAALERVDHFVVSFSGNVIPHAIQVSFSHDADVTSGGLGKVYVSNPRGDLKSISWNDDGINLQVLLTPTGMQSVSDLVDFKFYVAGGVTNLAALDVIAVDINGLPVLGVSASVVVGK